MKLRIANNSIRLRLGRQEVARLAAGLPLEERADLPPTPLVYALSASTHATEPTISFTGGRLELVLPAASVQQWAQSDQVGIESRLDGDGGRSLHVLVEKDFKCLHGDGTDQSDTYPHPMDVRQG